MRSKKRLTLLLFLITSFAAFAEDIKYLEVKPDSGDGIETLLTRYDLPFNDDYFDSFKELNQGKLTSYDGLHLSKTYKLPMRVYTFDGKSIRTTINNNDYDYALAIQNYNDNLTKKGIKKGNFRHTKELWVPLYGNEAISAIAEGKVAAQPDPTPIQAEYKIFGNRYKDIKPIDNSLFNRVFYVVSGHGGPDPGAVGEKNGYVLCEDEYAYDVSLRLARNLLLHNATVYVIVRDDNDGIRDETYLNASVDEYYYGGFEISANQRTRLQKRVAIINELYQNHKSTAKSQNVIVTHVDSRYEDKRIDIFFYYKEGSSQGEQLAQTLLTTIEDKYHQAQPGRGYAGTTSFRNLYMLNNCTPECTYIEIGNIQNPLDQQRILLPDNRQATANWLTDGILRYYK